MDHIEHLNDQIKQQRHAEMMKFAREAKRSGQDRPSPAQQHSFMVALSRAVTNRPVPQPQPVPKDTSHKGLDGGIVKITACVDNGDDTFSTKNLLVQATAVDA